MKLFNIKDLLKMLVQNEYELTLFKLTCLFLFKAGYVKLRGDRYTYKGLPVVIFDEIAGNCHVSLYDPFKKSHISISKINMTSINTNSFIIVPGKECKKQVLMIDAHLRHINEMHLKKPIIIVP